jgi:hypothetical protein
MLELQITVHADNSFISIVTALIKMDNGDEFYVCDSWDELTEALSGDDRFLGHKVIGGRPVEVIINPKYVQTAHNIDSDN